VIKYLVGIGKLLTNRLLIYDGLKIAFSEFIINKNQIVIIADLSLPHLSPHLGRGMDKG